jgi:hypothetical protein
MFLASGYERETDSGYEKAVDIAGTPGFEKWNTDAGSGELNLLVGKRYLVTIEGRRVSDPKTLRDFAANLDAAKLAALE